MFEGARDSYDANENGLDDNDDSDVNDIGGDDMAGLYPDYAALAEDEIHDALVNFAGDALSLLYDIQEKQPDAVIDGKPIHDCITQLEHSLAEACKINDEYERTKKDLIEMRAHMIYIADLTIGQLFFSHAIWVGHLRPTPSFVRGYFDAKEARSLIDQNRLLPCQNNN